jgi:hypothetical protein
MEVPYPLHTSASYASSRYGPIQPPAKSAFSRSAGEPGWARTCEVALHEFSESKVLHAAGLQDGVQTEARIARKGGQLHDRFGAHA